MKKKLFSILLILGLTLTNPLVNAQQIDPSFNSVSTSTVTSISLQLDGKILAGGGGCPGPGGCALKRLNDNGDQDNSFNVGAGFIGSIWATAIQQDGKVIAGGDFNSFNGVTQNKIIRLNPDGSKDNSFNVGTGFADGYVYSIAIQSDGKILIGGTFTSFNGNDFVSPSWRIIRLNSDGTQDLSFNNANGGFNDNVYSITLQPDGKILVGGRFTSYNNIVQNGLIRLNTDGSRDTSFNIGTGTGGGGSAAVASIALQQDGKILIGGEFILFNGALPAAGLVRLLANGTRDTSFNIGYGGFDDRVNSMVIKPNGKILLGGSFINFNNATQRGLIQLNSDGSKDTTFNIGSGFNSVVYSIALQPDGKILVGGAFTLYNGTTVNKFVRLMENTNNNPNPNNYLATYPFNGNTNDESGNNYHATNNGAVLTTDRLGNTNKAYDFNGTSNYIQFPPAIGTGVTTVSMWFKPTSSQDNQIILRNRMYGYEVAYNKVYDGTDRANKLTTKLYINNSSGGYNEYTYIHPSNLNLNQWYHISFTYDGDYYKVYLNNVMVYQSNSFGTGTVKYENSGAGYVLGRDGDTPYWYFKGSIDDLGIWGRALSASELNIIYTGGTLSTTDFEMSKSITLYPNPVKDILHIKVSEGINITNCEMFDISGKSMKAEIFDNNIDVSQIQKGLYLIKLKTSKGILTEKFIKE